MGVGIAAKKKRCQNQINISIHSPLLYEERNKESYEDCRRTEAQQKKDGSKKKPRRIQQDGFFFFANHPRVCGDEQRLVAHTASISSRQQKVKPL